MLFIFDMFILFAPFECLKSRMNHRPCLLTPEFAKVEINLSPELLINFQTYVFYYKSCLF